MQGIKKNCFDWKRWLQESSISVRGKSNLWGYELLLITVCILVLYGNIRINASGGVWCGGDSLVVMDDVFTKIFLMPFFLYLLNFLLRDDMRIQVILREQGKRILWGKFMFKTMLASVCFTVNVFLITFFFSMGMGNLALNWKEEESFFYRMCGRVLKDVNVGMVSFWFLLLNILLYLAIGSMFGLLYWLTKRTIWGWIVCSMIPILYFRPPMELSGILKIPNILWENWFRKEDFFTMLIYMFAVVVCIFLAGEILAKRREFMNER